MNTSGEKSSFLPARGESLHWLIAECLAANKRVFVLRPVPPYDGCLLPEWRNVPWTLRLVYFPLHQLPPGAVAHLQGLRDQERQAREAANEPFAGQDLIDMREAGRQVRAAARRRRKVRK